MFASLPPIPPEGYHEVQWLKQFAMERAKGGASAGQIRQELRDARALYDEIMAVYEEKD